MISIILVDDHVIMRSGLRVLLESESDMEVIGEANNGREAVKITSEKNPDIVVMDIAMRDMNGIQATQQIKNEKPEIKIIALSMHSEKQIVIGMLKAGASGYLLKDSTSTELVEAVRKVYLGHNYISQKVSDVVLPALSNINKDFDKLGFDKLTSRESEILQLLAEGNSTKSIAEILFISVKTVESHRANIMKKLNINNLPELTKYAVRTGLTTLED